MNKIIVVIAILAILGIGAYLLATKTTVLSSLGVGSSNAPKFTLVKESGTVSYKEKETDQYKELTNEEMDLVSGSFIKTDADSYARVFMPDNSLISIDQSTEIQINFQDNKTDITQLIGKTWNRVQTITQGGEFKVQTPNTVAAVRGTIFGVGVDDDNHSRVFSIEHTINVEDKNNKSDNKDVSDGKIAEVNNDTGDTKVNLGDIPADFKNSFWFKRNLVIDEEWQKIKDMKGDLEKLLKEALSNRSDYVSFKLGLPPVETDPQKIQDKLADAYKLSKITSTTCQENSQDQIQLAIDEVKLYQSNVQNADAIINLLVRLKSVCADGKIDLQEAQDLQVLVNKANGQ